MWRIVVSSPSLKGSASWRWQSTGAGARRFQPKPGANTPESETHTFMPRKPNPNAKKTIDEPPKGRMLFMSPAWFSQLKPLGWLINNITGFCAYQMLLESVSTCGIGFCLMNKFFTIQEAKQWFESINYPCMYFMNFESGIHTEDYTLIGGAKLDRHLVTSLHSAHNITMGLLPFQVLFMLATYPLVLRAWPRVKSQLIKLPILDRIFTPVTIPAEGAGWMNRIFGSALGGAAVQGAAATRSSAESEAIKRNIGKSAKWRK